MGEWLNVYWRYTPGIALTADFYNLQPSTWFRYLCTVFGSRIRLWRPYLERAGVCWSVHPDTRIVHFQLHLRPFQQTRRDCDYNTKHGRARLYFQSNLYRDQ